MSSVFTRVWGRYRRCNTDIVFSIGLLILVSINGHPTHDSGSSGLWTPIDRADIFSRYKPTYHMSRRHDLTNYWMPTQELVFRNVSAMDDKFNNSVKLEENSFRATHFKTKVASQEQHGIKTDVSSQINQASKDYTLAELPEHVKEDNLRTEPSRSIRQPRVQKQALHSTNHINKQNDKVLNNNADKKYDSEGEILQSFNEQVVTHRNEVTEIITDDLITEQTVVTDNIGYSYGTPPLELKDDLKANENAADNNKFTKNFQNILAKYDINANDELNNYELSKHVAKNPQNNIIYLLPTPSWHYHIPSLYHIQNNVPLHRLFALFLSNYGYYLPQFYKTQGGYGNLYGHLAKNNMHNNKPFGSYKVVSDTN